MSDGSKIEWTDATWNPVVGCSLVSPGCTNCYAMRMAARIEKMTPMERRGEASLPHHYAALTELSKAGAVWTGRVTRARTDILTSPLRWKRPRRIFVCSMGDLFHESVPDIWIDSVFAVMSLASQHTFQVPTKRAARMSEYLRRLHLDRLRDTVEPGEWPRTRQETDARLDRRATPEHRAFFRAQCATLPLPNVWLGVSAERQQEANERIPHLLATPAAMRFVSAEPLLGPIDLTRIRIAPDHHTIVDALRGYGLSSGGRTRIDWVITGGESGPGARPMHPDWARSLRDQCADAGAPFFFKQWGGWMPDGTAAHRMIISRDGSIDIPDDRAADESAGEVEMMRVGKKAAGRRLDGVEHDDMPEQLS